MSNATNIFDLPVGQGNTKIGPMGESGQNTFSISEVAPPSSGSSPGQGQPVQTHALSQDTINQIVSGLQKATTNGMTQLPSRDIVQTTHHIVQDETTVPNYIPPVEGKSDYISEYETTKDITNEYESTLHMQNRVDVIYDELHTPILLAILFFLFQLPIVNTCMFRYFPILYSKDGNKNLYGLLFTSIFYALIYYILHIILGYVSSI